MEHTERNGPARPQGCCATYTLILTVPGIPIGTMQGLDYEKYTLTLEKGDTLFVFTDGVPEVHDEKDALFGEQALLDTLNADPARDPKSLIDSVTKAVGDYQGECDPFDDVTMLCVRMN